MELGAPTSTTDVNNTIVTRAFGAICASRAAWSSSLAMENATEKTMSDASRLSASEEGMAGALPLWPATTDHRHDDFAVDSAVPVHRAVMCLSKIDASLVYSEGCSMGNPISNSGESLFLHRIPVVDIRCRSQRTRHHSGYIFGCTLSSLSSFLSSLKPMCTHMNPNVCIGEKTRMHPISTKAICNALDAISKRVIRVRGTDRSMLLDGFASKVVAKVMERYVSRNQNTRSTFKRMYKGEPVISISLCICCTLHVIQSVFSGLCSSALDGLEEWVWSSCRRLENWNYKMQCNDLERLSEKRCLQRAACAISAIRKRREEEQQHHHHHDALSSEEACKLHLSAMCNAIWPVGRDVGHASQNDNIKWILSDDFWECVKGGIHFGCENRYDISDMMTLSIPLSAIPSDHKLLSTNRTTGVGDEDTLSVSGSSSSLSTSSKRSYDEFTGTTPSMTTVESALFNTVAALLRNEHIAPPKHIRNSLLYNSYK